MRQDGALHNPGTYQIMAPETVGARQSRVVLGRQSGPEALIHSLQELGYQLDPGQLDQAYQLFRLLADTKKTILEEDLLAIFFQGTLEDAPKQFRLEHLHVVCGRNPSHATVRVREGKGPVIQAEAQGDGPIDATFAALQEVVPWEVRLEDFSLAAASPGTDAVGEAHLHVRVNGHVFTGRAASTDVVDAAARAYLNALDKAAHARSLEASAFERVAYWGV
jgi:2-isopropylmalate synthase